MNLTDYRNFTHTLLQNIQADPRVIGLVALGSMAEQNRTPDDWSDHDFFLIVQSGTQELFRQDISWLPYADRIIMSIRETEHGLKVMYDIPHLIEFAVFDANELHGAKANDYHILLNRGDVDGIMTQISVPKPKPDYHPQRDLLMVLSLLYVGAGRYARGEKLSAHVFIKHHLIHHLIPLLIYANPTDITKLDNLDPFRRFELVYPQFASTLNSALALPIMACAKDIFALVESLSKSPNIPYPTQAAQIVRQYLDDCDK